VEACNIAYTPTYQPFLHRYNYVVEKTVIHKINIGHTYIINTIVSICDWLCYVTLRLNFLICIALVWYLLFYYNNIYIPYSIGNIYEDRKYNIKYLLTEQIYSLYLPIFFYTVDIGLYIAYHFYIGVQKVHNWQSYVML
jgi:hypothetical protein